MFAALTGAGLSAAAGLNAYVPFLLVALLARFTDVFDLPASFAWIQSGWAIAICAVLLLAEVVLDKIPAIDSVNDVIGTAVRPTVGGIIAAAAQSNTLDDSAFLRQHQWVAAVGGVLVAGLVHSGKAAVRPVANVGTGGLGAPVLSASEDVASVGLSLVAVFAPVLVVVALVLLAWVTWALWRRVRRRRQRWATAAS